MLSSLSILSIFSSVRRRELGLREEKTARSFVFFSFEAYPSLVLPLGEDL